MENYEVLLFHFKSGCHAPADRRRRKEAVGWMTCYFDIEDEFEIIWGTLRKPSQIKKNRWRWDTTAPLSRGLWHMKTRNITKFSMEEFLPIFDERAANAYFWFETNRRQIYLWIRRSSDGVGPREEPPITQLTPVYNLWTLNMEHEHEFGRPWPENMRHRLGYKESNDLLMNGVLFCKFWNKILWKMEQQWQCWENISCTKLKKSIEEEK